MRYDWAIPAAVGLIVVAAVVASETGLLGQRRTGGLQLVRYSPYLQLSDVGGLRQRAQAYYEQGRYDKAEADLREALAIAPGDIHAQAHLGAVLAAQGREYEAEWYYIQTYEHLAQSAHNYSALLERRGDHFGAVILALYCHERFPEVAGTMCPTVSRR